MSISGLGQAPFRVIRVREDNSLLNEGQKYWCDHCGTMLKNRHFIKSSDGKTSIVGIDCLKKTGDAGLIAGQRQLEKELAAERRMAKITAEQHEREAVERKLLGGRTLDEVTADFDSQESELLKELATAVSQTKIAKILEASNSPFGFNMVEAASKGERLTQNMQVAITNLAAKALSGGARRNSKAYKAAFIEAGDLLWEMVKLNQECIQKIRNVGNERFKIRFKTMGEVDKRLVQAAA